MSTKWGVTLISVSMFVLAAFGYFNGDPSMPIIQDVMLQDDGVMEVHQIDTKVADRIIESVVELRFYAPGQHRFEFAINEDGGTEVYYYTATAHVGAQAFKSDEVFRDKTLKLGEPQEDNRNNGQLTLRFRLDPNNTRSYEYQLLDSEKPDTTNKPQLFIPEPVTTSPA